MCTYVYAGKMIKHIKQQKMDIIVILYLKKWALGCLFVWRQLGCVLKAQTQRGLPASAPLSQVRAVITGMCTMPGLEMCVGAGEHS